MFVDLPPAIQQKVQDLLHLGDFVKAKEIYDCFVKQQISPMS